MRHEDLPERWQRRLVEHLRARGEETFDRLSAYDFASAKTVRLEFEDESFAEFRYAFVLEMEGWNEVGVFTEHCGYHLFVRSSLKIMTL